MKPLILHAPEVRRLCEHGSVLVVRPLTPQPVASTVCGDPMWGHRDMAGEFGQHVFGACAARVMYCPLGAVGEQRWIQERHALDETGRGSEDRSAYVYYEADGICTALSYDDEWGWQVEHHDEFDALPPDLSWRRPQHMPVWAARSETIRVESVRVVRLHDLVDDEALNAGIVRLEPTAQDLADGCTSEDVVYLAPGVRQGWGLTKAMRDQDRWAPTARHALRLLVTHRHSILEADNPWVWAVRVIAGEAGC